MNIDEFDGDDDIDVDADQWESNYQFSPASGKPSPMRTSSRKSMPYWQRIERLKEEAMLHKQISQDEYNYLD